MNKQEFVRKENPGLLWVRKRGILNPQVLAGYFINTSWVNSAPLFPKVNLRNQIKRKFLHISIVYVTILLLLRRI